MPLPLTEMSFPTIECMPDLLIMLPSLSRLSFTKIQGALEELPDKSRPFKKQVYQTALCPYCQESIKIVASKLESQLPRRMNEHLRQCADFPYMPMLLPRSRSLERERKPCGRSKTPMTQTYIDSHGKIARHELGSLLKCIAPGTRARDQRAIPLTAKESKSQEIQYTLRL